MEGIKRMQRFGEVIKVRPEKYEEYCRLHDNIWPEIVELLKKANLQNFTIFYRDGYLFKYFEYTGEDYESDMKMLNESEINRKWLSFTDPCQMPVDSAESGVWWAPMENIFHF